MYKVFIDIDVILDFLIDREPLSKDAAVVFSLSETGKIKAFASGLSFANSYFILRRFSSHRRVIRKLNLLSKVIEIIDAKKQVILSALESEFKDFEDAIQHYTALEDPNIKILLTRNIKDYKHSNLSIMTPETYVKLINKKNCQACT